MARALGRLDDRLRADAPALAAAVGDWLGGLTRGNPRESYFASPRAYPLVHLPWWAGTTLADAPDRAFHDDVAYASVTGYLVVRLLDDLMDGDREVPRAAVPAVVVLHTEYIRTYQRRFPAGHAFWDELAAASLLSSETAAKEASLADIDRAAFLAASARKTAGVRIPLAAVCLHAGRGDVLDAWYDLADRLGRWHQMLNDVRDWQRDLARGGATYFLSEAGRRGMGGDAVTAWVVRDGLAWARGELDGWMRELRAAASRLGSAAVDGYLARRQRDLDAAWASIEPAAAARARVADAFARPAAAPAPAAAGGDQPNAVDSGSFASERSTTAPEP